jgi:hypothetical protein
MSVLVLDAGNSILKGKIARREKGEIAFPHALRQLTESEYQKILTRARTNGSTKDYIRVNGTPHANLGTEEFTNAIVEEPWTDGRALIPESWQN